MHLRARSHSVALLIAVWVYGSAVRATEDFAKRADYPTVYAYSGFVGAPPSGNLPHITYHNDARVLSGLELGRYAKLGIIALWSQTRLRLSRDEDTEWYRSITLGPIFGYTRRDWCVHAMAAFGFAGQEWTRESRRVLPVLLACWAPSEQLLLRIGATAAWGPDRLRPIPLLAWVYKRGRFDTRGMVPLSARASYYVSRDFSVGAGGAGFLLPYATNSATHGPQLGVVYAVFGPQLGYRTPFGIGVRLTLGGAMTPLVVDERGNDFASRAISPATMLMVYVDEGIRD